MSASQQLSTSMHVLERGPAGAAMHAYSEQGQLDEHPLGTWQTSHTLFSPDGRFLASIKADEVTICDTGSNMILHSISSPGTIALHFSSTSKYLSVYQKANATGAGDKKNLCVYEVKEGLKLYACFQKSFTKADWPYIQFSADDSIACRAVTNEVHFLRCSDFGAQALRLRVPRLVTAKLSPGHPATLATFVPEINGQPGSVCVYTPPPNDSDAVIELPPLARKSFFRIQEVDFNWAHDGSAVLILGSSDVDATNQSYYVETSLHFMCAEGDLDCKVSEKLHEAP